MHRKHSRSDDNQRPVLAAKQALGKRCPASGRRPELSLGTCVLNVSCATHCRQWTGFAARVWSGDPERLLTEERYSPFRPAGAVRCLRVGRRLSGAKPPPAKLRRPSTHEPRPTCRTPPTATSILPSHDCLATNILLAEAILAAILKLHILDLPDPQFFRLVTH